MSNSRQYQQTIPFDPGTDLDTLRWLVRESFETTAAADGLVVTEYSDDEIVSPAAIDPAAAKKLDRPVADYVWRRFTATFTRPEPPPPPDVCGYCAPHPGHKTTCAEADCICPGWPK